MYLNSIRCYHGLGFVGLKHVGNTVVGKLEAWKPGEFTTVNRSSITGYPSLVPDASRCWWRFSNIIGIFKPRLLAKTDPILTSFFSDGLVKNHQLVQDVTDFRWKRLVAYGKGNQGFNLAGFTELWQLDHSYKRTLESKQTYERNQIFTVIHMLANTCLQFRIIKNTIS